ncbi:bifunctional protein HldE [Mycolicibacterium arabiense]|uniref:D-glycero-beta-D-manno-heptose 1-phosphate adenylyltransferase n=1 Tax=Mycolicibacterium arabiense TaxID=1286181 RepID=A0A7I7RYE5_9MYCO|nr:D-glycero-beta-D-manno-heptose 1-phosphate adenylyltransferase [Mycolicibacterium arabiense]MCV7374339.1 D-glycero-beta-D-manno-heptose 1-phosphate adenylyltransferase [Mycolicibacterium arabiense]BBY49597.1 bifunctional protein HldE [Mycolicibacterium arabiense]
MSAGPLVIVGDAMLDVDLEGSATRLSPEAPVPVVDTERVWHRPGGAGLAALLAARHEEDVVLIAGIASDPDGRRLRELLHDGGVRVVGLPMSGSTVTKTRVRARGQSVLRIDHGDASVTPGPLAREVTEAIAGARAICVADYGAGLTALPALRDALTAATATVPVVWDPHPRGQKPIPGCALVTPNEAEARHFSGDEPFDALRERWGTAALCVTVGARGARLFVRGGERSHVGVPKLVAAASADVCGAGDRFAVAASVALGDGATPAEAVRAAVEAAARFVAAGGASAVSAPAAVARFEPAATVSDEWSGADVTDIVDRLRAQGRTVVATGGCFDLLHTGHVRLLRQARELGDALIVLINSDDSVRRIKGDDRPIVSAPDRARVLSALGCVDAVVTFDESTPEAMLELVRPDVWVKGGDYAVDDLPETEVVRRHGGDVVIVPTVAGYSSSRLIAAARSDLTRKDA